MKISTKAIITPQDLARVKEFAASFGHSINEKRKTVVFMDENQTWLGYFQLIETPIVMMALHPELAAGRVALECIKRAQYSSEMVHGEAITGVNPGSVFEELLPRLDFKEMNLKLFKS